MSEVVVTQVDRDAAQSYIDDPRHKEGGFHRQPRALMNEAFARRAQAEREDILAWLDRGLTIFHQNDIAWVRDAIASGEHLKGQAMASEPTPSAPPQSPPDAL